MADHLTATGIPVRVTYSNLTVTAGQQNLSCCGKRQIIILDDVSGVLEPGSLTLVIGPPGSGAFAVQYCQGTLKAP